MKKIFLALAALAFTSLAQAAPAVAPDDVVKGTTDTLQKLIAANHEKYRKDLPGFYKVVDSTLVPHFDTRYIGQLVLARNWRSATEDQRTRFQNAFKNMLIRSYANSMLDNYDSVSAEWQPLRMSPDTSDVTVNSRLMRRDGPPVNVSFQMHIADNEWRVYDILVENLSLISNFRAQFASEIKRTSLDDVISRMESGQYVTGKQPAPAK